MAPGKTFLLSCALFLLGGCATSQCQPGLPYRAWFVGLGAPEHMEVWVESVDVIDRRGLAYERISGGVPSYTGTVAGWPKHPAGGAGKDLPGVDLPEIVFVRWQSMVEPQTYNVRINIPEWVREEMLKPQRGYCHFQGKWLDGQFRKDITIGLAPGGIAKAWVGGPCLQSIEIGRFEAAVSKLGPSLGQNEGRYAYPLSDKAKAYIEQHGCPMAHGDSMPTWAPPNPWEKFPDVDAERLGSLQGNLEHWWQYCWWPYWQSLTREQREEWLQDPAHPEAWREYVQLQDGFDGIDAESPA